MVSEPVVNGALCAFTPTFGYCALCVSDKRNVEDERTMADTGGIETFTQAVPLPIAPAGAQAAFRSQDSEIRFPMQLISRAVTVLPLMVRTVGLSDCVTSPIAGVTSSATCEKSSKYANVESEAVEPMSTRDKELLSVATSELPPIAT